MQTLSIRALSLFICLVLFSLGLPSLNAAEKRVLVSMAPYVTIVQEIAGDEVQVDLLVPTGYSSHTYEPTPKQIIQAARATLWFTIGEPFEKRALIALQSENLDLRAIDLREGLSLMTETCHDHQHGSDPHIWMSPQMMEAQAQHIAKGLKTAFPELASKIESHLQTLIKKLESLDQEIQKKLEKKKGQIIFVSHPAYGYFCHDYNLKQVSIESEGKDPSPKQLTTLIEFAKKQGVKTIFVQRQYSSKAAELVAHEIGAHIVSLDPYSPDYFANMRSLADHFAKEP